MKPTIIGILLLLVFTLTACQSSEPIPGNTQIPSNTQNTSQVTETTSKETQTPMTPQTTPVIIIAHRGARSLAPENTIMAAEIAYNIGADMWELDVAMTYDGELVVIHDDTLTRTSNAAVIYPKKSPWNVHQFTLTELKTLDFGSWFLAEDPFGTIKEGLISVEDQEKMKNIQIPTLEEALLFTRDNDWKVNIEIKDVTGTPGDATIVEQVVSLVEELDMADSVIISSFNHTYLRRVKKVNPELAIAPIVNEGVSDPVALLNDLGAQAYHPGIKRIGDISRIALARNAGFDVNVWTVNDIETMLALIEAGASGLFTDFPQLGVQIRDGIIN
jgi:glycerophosphoryl diester phosphodiesterase